MIENITNSKGKQPASKFHSSLFSLFTNQNQVHDNSKIKDVVTLLIEEDYHRHNAGFNVEERDTLDHEGKFRSDFNQLSPIFIEFSMAVYQLLTEEETFAQQDINEDDPEYRRRAITS